MYLVEKTKRCRGRHCLKSTVKAEQIPVNCLVIKGLFAELLIGVVDFLEVVLARVDFKR